MNDERLRELLRSHQERRNSQSLMHQFQNSGASPNLTSLMLARAGSPAEAPAPSPSVLDQLFANQEQRRSSLFSSESVGQTTNVNDLSSLAISREIKRLEDLQRQLTSTGGSSYSLPSRLGLAANADRDQSSSLLQQYLMLQKLQASPNRATSLASNRNLAMLLNDASTSQAPESESQFLQEARLLAHSRPNHSTATTFGAAAMAKAPAPFPEIPSNSPYVAQGGRKMRGGVIEPFPEKLHRMLTEVTIAGRSDVISWVSNTAFAIHKSNEFFETIVPLYFKQSRLSSFKRQLNLYGFELIPNGPSRGCYHHPLFQRDQPELCRRMRRVAVKVSAAKAASNAEYDKEGDNSGSEDELERKVASTSGSSQKSEQDS